MKPRFIFIFFHTMLLLSRMTATAQPCNDAKLYREINQIKIMSNQKELNAAIKYTDSLIHHLQKQGDTTCRHFFSLISLKGMALIKNDQLGDALILFDDLQNKLKITQYKDIEAHAYLSLALINELMNRPASCKKYLTLASSLTDKYKLLEPRSRLFVRMASYHRVFFSNNDSCHHYSKLALNYIANASEQKDVGDTYYLMGACSPTASDKVFYRNKAIETFTNSKDVIASLYLSFGNFQELIERNKTSEAEVYLDSLKIKYLDVIKETSLEKSTGLAIYYEKKKNLSILKKDYKKALEYEELYSKYQRDFVEAQNKSYLSKIQDEFLFEKEQRKTEELLEKSHLYKQILLASFIFITVLVVLLYVNYRQKQKIKQQKDLIEDSLDEVQKLSNKNEVLLTEAHHRINNSLQNVIAILQIQKEKVNALETKEIINDLSNRIQCISLIHEQIHKNQQSENINLAQFITTILELLNQLSVSWDLTQSKINIDTSIFINNETAMPLGIITNELVTNSLKHANLPIDAQLKISLQISKGENGIFLFDYADNGEQKSEPRSGSSLGFMLINSMVKQLNSHWEYSVQNGFHASFEFKIKNTSVV